MVLYFVFLLVTYLSIADNFILLNATLPLLRSLFYLEKNIKIWIWYDRNVLMTLPRFLFSFPIKDYLQNISQKLLTFVV